MWVHAHMHMCVCVFLYICLFIYYKLYIPFSLMKTRSRRAKDTEITSLTNPEAPVVQDSVLGRAVLSGDHTLASWTGLASCHALHGGGLPKDHHPRSSQRAPPGPAGGAAIAGNPGQIRLGDL